MFRFSRLSDRPKIPTAACGRLRELGRASRNCGHSLEIGCHLLEWQIIRLAVVNHSITAVVDKDRGFAGKHIVRVAYSQPARRVTYSGMSLTWPFINPTRVDPRPRVWLTATVTATRTNMSARRRTSNRPNRFRLDVIDTRSSTSRPKPQQTTSWAARAFEAPQGRYASPCDRLPGQCPFDNNAAEREVRMVKI